MQRLNGDLGYNPLRYFWIAEYDDGMALPQFDPETGLENLADPDWLPIRTSMYAAVDNTMIPLGIRKPRPAFFAKKRLARFGWYPFPLGLAIKIYKATGRIVVPSNNPVYKVELKDGDKLVAYRHNMIHYGIKGGDPTVKTRETTYVLGVEGKEIMRISEEGKLL